MCHRKKSPTRIRITVLDVCSQVADRVVGCFQIVAGLCVVVVMDAKCSVVAKTFRYRSSNKPSAPAADASARYLALER